MTIPSRPKQPAAVLRRATVRHRLQSAARVDELHLDHEVAERLVPQAGAVADRRVAAAPGDLHHDDVQRDRPRPGAAAFVEAPTAKLLVGRRGADAAQRLRDAVLADRADQLDPLQARSCGSIGGSRCRKRLDDVGRQHRDRAPARLRRRRPTRCGGSPPLGRSCGSPTPTCTISRTPCFVRGTNVTAGVLRTVRPQFWNLAASTYQIGLPSASRRSGWRLT